MGCTWGESGGGTQLAARGISELYVQSVGRLKSAVSLTHVRGAGEGAEVLSAALADTVNFANTVSSGRPMVCEVDSPVARGSVAIRVQVGLIHKSLEGLNIRGTRWGVGDVTVTPPGLLVAYLYLLLFCTKGKRSTHKK